MGYLTTFTIYNDAVHMLKDKKLQQKFCEALYYAAIGDNVCDVSLGNHCNAVKVQKHRHADDWTIYLHSGNTLIEMNEYSKETKQFLNYRPDVFERDVAFMAGVVKGLKKLIKEYKAIQKEQKK